MVPRAAVPYPPSYARHMGILCSLHKSTIGRRLAAPFPLARRPIPQWGRRVRGGSPSLRPSSSGVDCVAYPCSPGGFWLPAPAPPPSEMCKKKIVQGDLRCPFGTPCRGGGGSLGWVGGWGSALKPPLPTLTALGSRRAPPPPPEPTIRMPGRCGCGLGWGWGIAVAAAHIAPAGGARGPVALPACPMPRLS